MPLKIKDVAKSKGMTMTQIAEKLGIHPITLSQSLNGNPTLSRLTEVADTFSHLLLCFLYEHCLTDAHIGGAGLGGDGGDVASNESVVGGGGDDGSHIQKAL